MHPPAGRAVGTGAGVSGKGGAPLVKALAGLGWTSGGRSGQEAGDRVRWSAVLCRMAWLPVALVGGCGTMTGLPGDSPARRLHGDPAVCGGRYLSTPMLPASEVRLAY